MHSSPTDEAEARDVATVAPDDLVRYQRAAARLGTTPGTLRAMVSRGTVPHIRIGRRMVRFSLRDLDAWIAAHRQPAGVRP